MNEYDSHECIWRDEVYKKREEVRDLELALKVANRTAQEEIKKLEADLEEERVLREKLAGLLTKTAIALKGPEPELVMWDWSDLPEEGKRVRQFIDAVLKYDNNISETAEQSREEMLAAISKERDARAKQTKRFPP